LMRSCKKLGKWVFTIIAVLALLALSGCESDVMDERGGGS